ncbi:MAG: ACP phosphodiesterase [Pseudomonadales bacterium]
MNFLAHFHLAKANDDLLAGALLGDFVKGPLRGNFCNGIERGIRLHRKIDAHTDHYVQTAALHNLFPAHYRRYLGIILDLYFDFLLSRYWHDYSPQPLAAFAADTCGALQIYEADFPPKCFEFYQRLSEHRLLERYGEKEIMVSILERLAVRLPQPNPLATCWPDLQANEQRLSDEFVIVYDQLQTLSADFSSTLNNEVIEQ